MRKPVKSLGDLEKGIKHLLSESRCSFSDEEKVLLNDCLKVIKQAKRENNLNHVIRIVELLAKVFIAGNNLKDIF